MRGAMEWVVVIAGAVLIALIVKTFLIQAFWIPSESMEATLVKNDRVLVNKLSYRLHGVNRGDVVVFERDPSQTGTDETKDLIKRVIGIPGDRIVIDALDSGKVTVNGEQIAEPYLQSGMTTTNSGPNACTEATPCVVPDHHLWVMGDNRINSRDSRFLGYISEDQVVGRAFALVWPFNRFGGL